jgi:hypothetical protein
MVRLVGSRVPGIYRFADDGSPPSQREGKVLSFHEHEKRLLKARAAKALRARVKRERTDHEQ